MLPRPIYLPLFILFECLLIQKEADLLAHMLLITTKAVFEVEMHHIGASKHRYWTSSINSLPISQLNSKLEYWWYWKLDILLNIRKFRPKLPYDGVILIALSNFCHISESIYSWDFKNPVKTVSSYRFWKGKYCIVFKIIIVHP